MQESQLVMLLYCGSHNGSGLRTRLNHSFLVVTRTHMVNIMRNIHCNGHVRITQWESAWLNDKRIPTYQLSDKENGFCCDQKAFPILQLLCKYTHSHFKGTYNTARSKREWQRIITYLDSNLATWNLRLAGMRYSFCYNISACLLWWICLQHTLIPLLQALQCVDQVIHRLKRGKR